MPEGVWRVQQCPVVTPSAALERVEGRRHRGPLSGWRHRNLLGRAVLHSTHYYACAEAHSRRLDIVQPRLAPVALEVALMLAPEALDAAPQESTHAGPLLGDGAADDRKSDRRIPPPEPPDGHVCRHAEVERNDAPAGSDHSRELAYDIGRVVDVPKQISECHVIK